VRLGYTYFYFSKVSTLINRPCKMASKSTFQSFAWQRKARISSGSRFVKSQHPRIFTKKIHYREYFSRFFFVPCGALQREQEQRKFLEAMSFLCQKTNRTKNRGAGTEEFLEAMS